MKLFVFPLCTMIFVSTQNHTMAYSFLNWISGSVQAVYIFPSQSSDSIERVFQRKKTKPNQTKTIEDVCFSVWKLEVFIESRGNPLWRPVPFWKYLMSHLAGRSVNWNVLKRANVSDMRNGIEWATLWNDAMVSFSVSFLTKFMFKRRAVLIDEKEISWLVLYTYVWSKFEKKAPAFGWKACTIRIYLHCHLGDPIFVLQLLFSRFQMRILQRNPTINIENLIVHFDDLKTVCTFPPRFALETVCFSVWFYYFRKQKMKRNKINAKHLNHLISLRFYSMHSMRFFYCIFHMVAVFLATRLSQIKDECSIGFMLNAAQIFVIVFFWSRGFFSS